MNNKEKELYKSGKRNPNGYSFKPIRLFKNKWAKFSFCVLIIFTCVFSLLSIVGVTSWSKLFSSLEIINTVHEQDSDFSIYCLDVGQSDCTIIKCNDEVMIIDTGTINQLYKIRTALFALGIDNIDYLHSLDSIDLANAINKTRKKQGKLKCFVQVNLSNNSNKTGLTEAKVIPFIKNLAKYEKIEVVGLMTIAEMTFDDDILEGYFKTLKELQEEVQALKLPHAPCTELSMGMSNDYKLAVKNGATMIRIGTLLSK